MTNEATTVQSQALDPAHYREVMGHYPTGVAVVTATSADGEPLGMVVGTFTAVSLDPPLVAFMPTTTSGTFALMRDADAYCINVLAHDQLELCRTMAVPRPGKFDEVSWHLSDHGAPALDDAVARIHCRTHDVITAGDHYIVLCEVEGMEVSRPVTPLLFFQGGYGGFSSGGLSAKGDAGLIESVRLAEVGRAQAERVARTLGCETALLVAANDHELTTAVTAYGPNVPALEPLGVRVPLMPPLGEAYVAWSDDVVVDAWLRRASSQEPEVVEKYRRRLAAVRESGYAVSRQRELDHPRYSDLREAMREYAAGDLTPVRERAVRSVISQSSAFFETIEIQDGETYDLGAIVVPVLGREGRVALCLRASQLPGGADAETVRGWISTLEAAAAEIGEQLREPRRAEYAAFLQATPGDFMM
ncbi:flavin reductase [Terrabacter sp. 2RAF25]|uniref:flavin reductase n=1 Tax=Terrabacter sp. 2RAF25 TaxID=3232998 RepID=UPI003F963407